MRKVASINEYTESDLGIRSNNFMINFYNDAQSVRVDTGNHGMKFIFVNYIVVLS